jgi:hypothetical protein
MLLPPSSPPWTHIFSVAYHISFLSAQHFALVNTSRCSLMIHLIHLLTWDHVFPGLDWPWHVGDLTIHSISKQHFFLGFGTAMLTAWTSILMKTSPFLSLFLIVPEPLQLFQCEEATPPARRSLFCVAMWTMSLSSQCLEKILKRQLACSFSLFLPSLSLFCH